MISNMTFSPDSSISRPRPSRFILMDVPPKITNQAMEIADGTSTTTVTNSRIVRPREIFAMNMPTNGDHEIHQAHSRVVHEVRNSSSTLPSLALTWNMARRFSARL